MEELILFCNGCKKSLSYTEYVFVIEGSPIDPYFYINKINRRYNLVKFTCRLCEDERETWKSYSLLERKQ